MRWPKSLSHTVPSLPGTFRVMRNAPNRPWSRAGGPAIVVYELTVDLDLVDAHRDGMRIGGRGLIDDALRIEQNEIA